jgi:hypothetical protein
MQHRWIAQHHVLLAAQLQHFNVLKLLLCTCPAVCVWLQVVRELAVPAGWEGQDQDLVALLAQETVQVGRRDCELTA